MYHDLCNAANTANIAATIRAWAARCGWVGFEVVATAWLDIEPTWPRMAHEVACTTTPVTAIIDMIITACCS